MNSNTKKKQQFSIQCRNNTLHLGERTLIMGILNVTPDSFSDGGLHFNKDQAIKRAFEIEAEGADILDIGGESTRPYAKSVPVNEELNRIIPVIESISGKLHIPISVDTRKSEVAKAAVQAGASMINDISGLLFDEQMAVTAAELKLPIIIMHSSADPSIMQSCVDYVEIISDIYKRLQICIQDAVDAGIARHNIIIDPGIGFGKTVEQNFKIIKNLYQFQTLNCPILIGVSRKSFIGKVLDVDETDRIMGTAAAVTACILNGAHIVRVHDVFAMKQVVEIADFLKKD